MRIENRIMLRGFLSFVLLCQVSAFCPLAQYKQLNNNALYMSDNSYLNNLASESPELGNKPKRNLNRPELPEIPGDYDWDEKYAGDSDWVTENVPGKVTMNEIDLARQVTTLGGLEEKWRKERIETEYENSINIGWVPNAELANGRFAMFFLITGLLTEYWTGISLPGQVEEMLRIAGVIGFDG